MASDEEAMFSDTLYQVLKSLEEKFPEPSSRGMAPKEVEFQDRDIISPTLAEPEPLSTAIDGPVIGVSDISTRGEVTQPQREIVSREERLARIKRKQEIVDKNALRHVEILVDKVEENVMSDNPVGAKYFLNSALYLSKEKLQPIVTRTDVDPQTQRRAKQRMKELFELQQTVNRLAERKESQTSRARADVEYLHGVRQAQEGNLEEAIIHFRSSLSFVSDYYPSQVRLQECLDKQWESQETDVLQDVFTAAMLAAGLQTSELLADQSRTGKIAASVDKSVRSKTNVAAETNLVDVDKADMLYWTALNDIRFRDVGRATKKAKRLQDLGYNELRLQELMRFIHNVKRREVDPELEDEFSFPYDTTPRIMSSKLAVAGVDAQTKMQVRVYVKKIERRLMQKDRSHKKLTDEQNREFRRTYINAIRLMSCQDVEKAIGLFLKIPGSHPMWKSAKEHIKSGLNELSSRTTTTATFERIAHLRVFYQALDALAMEDYRMANYLFAQVEGVIGYSQPLARLKRLSGPRKGNRSSGTIGTKGIVAKQTQQVLKHIEVKNSISGHFQDVEQVLKRRVTNALKKDHHDLVDTSMRSLQW